MTELNTFTPSTNRAYSTALLSNGSMQQFVIANSVTNYPGVGDGFNKFRGVAPGCNWAAAKVFTNSDIGYTTWMSAALDDLTATRIANNIKVINMSVGVYGSPGIDTTLRSKVNTAVNNGIVVVVSAGNDGGASPVDDPGRAAMAITVAAGNDEDQLTTYTSTGFSSPGSDEDYKPDIMAPGGSVAYYTGILSVDSGSADTSAFADQQNNDYACMQGTSMASPFAAGAAALVIDALQQQGVTWDFYSNQHARYVKMLLCATASETNANREGGSYNPTLQRASNGPSGFPAGKDQYEGYGMINPDAAVEATTLTYTLGSSANDTLGPSVYDRRVWARKIGLRQGIQVAATLTVPSSGDFDIYLYSATPTSYGTATILASSTQAGNDADEYFNYTPSIDANGLLVIKRISGYGTFGLTTQAPPQPPAQASDPNPANGATNVSVISDLGWTAGSGATSHDVYFGTSSPGTFQGNQTETTFDTGTMGYGTTYYWRIDEKNAGGTTTGVVWSFTTIYKHTLTSSSTDGGDVTAPGEGGFNYDHGTVVDITAKADLNHHFVNWTGTGVTAGKVASPTSASTTVTMDDNYTVVANFAIDQRALTTSSTVGGSVTTPGEPGPYYYDHGSEVNIIATPDTGFYFVNWTGSGVDAGKVADTCAASTTIIMDANYAVVANFATIQCTLIVNKVGNGSVAVEPNQTTYTYGTDVNLTANADLGWTFDSWSDDLGGSTNPTKITMTGNKTITATFTQDQYTIMVSADANGTIDPNGAIIKTYGQDQLFTAASHTGYTVDTWYLDGNNVQSGGDTYMLTNITANHTVAVTFEILEYVIAGYILEPDGNTPVAEVLLSTDDGNSVTDPNGYYQLIVNYGWSGTVTPEKEGYTFEPNSSIYANVTNDWCEANYVATLSTFIISGYVVDSNDGITPVNDVNVSAENGGGPYTSRYGGDSSITDANGYYEVWVDYNWSGKVVPQKYAYVFDPNSMTYSQVTTDYNDQDYSGTLMTFAVSGYIKNACSVPIQGVSVDANNGGGSNITDPNGYYEVWVDCNWCGTVTPSKANYAFEPPNIVYINVLEDRINQDYDANNIYDLDCDGSIGFGDVRIISYNWLDNFSQNICDFNGDGYVDWLDFAMFAEVWRED